jgi:hypothetical protein
MPFLWLNAIQQEPRRPNSDARMHFFYDSAAFQVAVPGSSLFRVRGKSGPDLIRDKFTYIMLSFDDKRWQNLERMFTPKGKDLRREIPGDLAGFATFW